MSHVPAPSDYSPPRNGPPPGSNVEPADGDDPQITPYPPDPPTVAGAELTVNVHQKGV